MGFRRKQISYSTDAVFQQRFYEIYFPSKFNKNEKNAHSFQENSETPNIW